MLILIIYLLAFTGLLFAVLWGWSLFLAASRADRRLEAWRCNDPNEFHSQPRIDKGNFRP